MTKLRKTAVALSLNAAPFATRSERASGVAAREALLDACFGANRQQRTCQRLRDGHAPAEGLAFSAVRAGALDGAWGMIVPTGRSLLKIAARRPGKALRAVPRAA